MEHLQKIPYVLSIFGPAAFFLLGLWLAYWIWYKHAKRLNLALKENEKLNKDYLDFTGDPKFLKAKEPEFNREDLDAEWELKQKDWDVKYANLEKDLKSKNALLLQKDKDIKASELKLINVNSQDNEWKNKLELENKKFTDLDLRFSSLAADKDKEYKLLLDEKNALKVKLDGNASSQTELEDKIIHLESEYDRVQLERKSTSQTITNLIAKVDALEAEKTAAGENTADADLIAELNAKISGLEGQLDGKNSELGNLNAKIDGGDLSIFGGALGLAGIAAGSKGDGSAKLGNLNAKIEDLEAQLAAKDAEVSASGGADAELADLKLKFGDLESQVSSKDAEILSLKGDLDAQASAETSGSGSVDVSKLAPAAFFTGTTAVDHDRYGFIYENKDAKYSDDLTEIKGVGDVLHPKLNEFGVYQFKQVALWDQENIDAFSEDLDFPGRVKREQWVNQAADLHRQHHGEHLAPVVNIYHPTPSVPRKSKEVLLEEFAGENVQVDDDLGVIYTSRPDEVDDLKKIWGVAKVLEGKLHEIGIYRFRQIAIWDEVHMSEFSQRLAFPGRIERDEWKKQAKEFHKEKYGEEV